MIKARVIPDWREVVEFSDSGPGRVPLLESEGYMSVMVGLSEGQTIPPHPSAAATFHFIEGSGAMDVDGRRVDVSPGTIIAVPPGTNRGVSADTRLVFLLVRGADRPAKPHQGKKNRMAMIIGMLVLMGIMAGMMFAPAVLMASRAPSDAAMRSFMYLPLVGMVVMAAAMVFFFRKMRHHKD